MPVKAAPPQPIRKYQGFARFAHCGTDRSVIILTEVKAERRSRPPRSAATQGWERHGRDQIRRAKAGQGETAARQGGSPARDRCRGLRGIRREGLCRDKARGCRRPRQGEQGPPLSLLQDQGRAVQGGDPQRHHLAFRGAPRAHGDDRALHRGISQRPLPLLHPGASRLAPRLHRAAPDLGRLQASRAHRSSTTRTSSRAGSRR